ncbi:EF-hand domain-containing protein [Chitinophaga sp. 22321]|uniref:EF-hand domain-containing protein n=1 Tax=Chitinophaga hostae TaxID=2831022 RepID=A0ABS5IZN2_9BACT|nr:EF-hand domain-containing protein [Chitinophaga hostae]MBS0028350.1 EF-hand domain-containing protein [Chitinophaga hostae]
MTKHLLAAGLLVATLASVKTYAQQPQQQQPQQDREGFFKKIDTDGDGKLSKTEVDVASKDNKRLAKLKDNFDAIDTNKDTFIDKDELKAYRKSQGPRKKEDGSK